MAQGVQRCGLPPPAHSVCILSLLSSFTGLLCFVLFLSFIYLSFKASECLTFRSPFQVQGKMASAVVFIGSIHSEVSGGFGPPAAGRNGGGQSACFPPSVEPWTSWSVPRVTQPLWLQFLTPSEATASALMNSELCSLLCDQPLLLNNSHNCCFIHETYSIILWNPGTHELFSPPHFFFLFTTFSRRCPMSEATTFIAIPAGKCL